MSIKLDISSLMNKTEFLVEATDCERNYAYELYVKTVKFFQKGEWLEPFKREQVEFLNKEGLKIVLELRFIAIKSYIVCFYHTIGQFSDKEAISDWLDENFPQCKNEGDIIRRTNVPNIHYLLQFIEGHL